MKIIITVATYWPYKDGTQNVTQYQAEGLVKLGHTVIVVTNIHPDGKKEETRNGVKIIRYPIKNKHNIYFGNKKDYHKLIKSLINDVDCMINVSSESGYTEWLFPLLKQINCKKILIEHGISDWTFHKKDFKSVSNFAHAVWRCLRFGFLYTFNRKYLKKYNYITNLHDFSHGNKFFKNKCGIDCKIIYNGVETSFFNQTKMNDAFMKTLPSKYILCVSNYGIGKNQIDTLKAFYLSKITDTAMIFIGSSINNYYNKLLKANDHFSTLFNIQPDIRFLHDIPRETIPFIVRNSEMSVMNSLSEHFPITICEAMASGVPFISTNVGIASYLPGVVIVNTVEDTAFWMRQLHNNPQVAKSLGQSGRNFAEKNLRIDEKVRQLNELVIS